MPPVADSQSAAEEDSELEPAAKPTDIAALLAQAAAEAPDRLAVVCASGRRLSWSDLDDEVGRVASGLSSSGIRAGQRVMIALPNRIEFISTYLGASRINAVAVPVNPGSSPSEFARMIEDSGCRMIVTDRTAIAQVRTALASIDEAALSDTSATRPRLVVCDATLQPAERSYGQLVVAKAKPVPTVPDPERLAVLLYTSGTSGRPRAAMLTHRALLSNIEQLATARTPLMHSDDVILGVLPLFHVYGLNAVLGGALRHRCKLVLVDRFDSVETLDVVDDEACSVLPLAPAVLASWVDAPDLAMRMGAVRLVLSGSAPLSAPEQQRFVEQSGIALHQGYGLTEAAPVVTSTLHSVDPDSVPAGSVGAPLQGIEVRLREPGGEAPHDGDPGEIVIRGENMFSGYWPDGSGGPDDEGWWPTGDVGYFDHDHNLHLVDRVKELVIVSGFNVYPSEIEDVIAELAETGEVAVIGTPDQATGEALAAFVVPADPHADPELVAAAVREHCAERLARFKQPSRIEVVEQLPVTAIGKVAKGRLRRIERDRTAALTE